MSQADINHLSTLQPESGKRLPTSLIHGFSTSQGGTTSLIRTERIEGDWVGVPRQGAAQLIANPHSRRKVFTLDSSHQGFTETLNTALLGGGSYPVLVAVLGTAAGAVSGGAGLLFTASTVGIDLGRRTRRVLARLGDEIWHVEEVGKTLKDNFFSGDRFVAMHVSSYLLIDPYRSRSQVGGKGWLLHEERKRVQL